MNTDTEPKTNQTHSTETDTPIARKIRIPPIILRRNAAKSIYRNAENEPGKISAKISADGIVHVNTSSVEHFRTLQRSLIDHKVEFHSYKLPEERTLKVVLKGIPTNISEDELKSELECYNFNVKLVKRFGPASKPMSICMVVLHHSPNAKAKKPLLR